MDGHLNYVDFITRNGSRIIGPWWEESDWSLMDSFHKWPVSNAELLYLSLGKLLDTLASCQWFGTPWTSCYGTVIIFINEKIELQLNMLILLKETILTNFRGRLQHVFTWLSHPSLGWIYVFSSFPPRAPPRPPPQQLLPLTSKPFQRNHWYLAQRIYESGEMSWMAFRWPWPKVTAVTLISKNLLVCAIK